MIFCATFPSSLFIYTTVALLFIAKMARAFKSINLACTLLSTRMLSASHLFCNTCFSRTISQTSRGTARHTYASVYKLLIIDLVSLDGLPLGPPVFIQHLTNCEIIENSAARFECKVSGNPEPEVEWYKDGRLLKESKQLTFLYDDNDNCKLIITKGTAADAGEYKVVAKNAHGKVSSTALLLIDTGSTDDETASESELSELSASENEEKTITANEEKITKYYTVQEELGKGRFGVVCKCVDNKTGKAYAAKFIKCTTPKERQDVIHEAEIMNSVRHKRLLRLTHFFQTPTEMILVMDLVTGGELFEKVVEDEFISEIEVSYYMKQILEGIQHMHQREVLHLDLKPENIMLIRPESKQIKLIDFGLARKYNPKENLKVMFGTPEFVAPEVIKYERITPATDLWSVGVIAYILMSGLSPFMGDTEAETLTNVQLADWDFDDPVFDEISEEAKDFISCLLVLRASKRNTVDQCLKHRWFTIKKDKGKKLKTDRLKAFTARRKWKRAITAIRSTNFLSRILGSRGSESDKKGSGGGGAGLLARVKAMHAAGIQGPEGGAPPASSPFLSPASAALSTSNSFTSVTVTERTQVQGKEEAVVTKKETKTETKGGKTRVETVETTKTTRNDDTAEEASSVMIEEVENG